MAQSKSILVNLGDEELGEFDFGKFSNTEAYLIENTFNLTTKGFLEGIGEMRAVALDALIWLLYYRAGKTVDKALIRWTFGELDLKESPVGPTEASAGSDETSGSELSPTSAI